MYSEALIAHETYPREVRAILDQHGMCRDAAFAGEVDRIMDRAGIKRRYFRHSGLTVDDLAELIFDRRITWRRMDCAETLELLDDLLVVSPAECPSKTRSKASARALDAMERRARSNRSRKYLCDVCGQIARGTRNSSLICGLCFEMHDEVRFMTRVDPTSEEVLEYARECQAPS